MRLKPSTAARTAMKYCAVPALLTPNAAPANTVEG